MYNMDHNLSIIIEQYYIMIIFDQYSVGNMNFDTVILSITEMNVLPEIG